MDSKLILYTRDGCGLCEQAAALVAQAGLSATPVDITTRIDLLERYRNTIPVLRLENQEIGWPFSAADVRELVTR